MSANLHQLETAVIELNQVIKRLPLSIVIAAFEKLDSKLPALTIMRDDSFSISV